MPTIQSLRAREILDSRGNPTVEAICTLSSGAIGIAAVPSGASTGIHEALEKRDGDKNRYNGLGVLSVVQSINSEINDAVIGKELDQRSLDSLLIALDGTKNKSRLGANAILAVSLSFARACAQDAGVELYEYLGSLIGAATYTLPQPMFNIINGGKHADSGLDVQEFMIGPVGFNTMKDKVRVASEITTALRKELKEKGYAVSIGDEGGFAPKLGSNEEALDLITKAIIDAGYTTEQVKIGLDAAASSMYMEENYHLKINGEHVMTNATDLIAWYEKLVSKYPIMSIEDGLAEDDWDGFAKLNEKLGGTVTIVGDDLTVTNIERIAQASEHKAINSVLIKPNQIGSLTETIDAIQLTKKNGWKAFMSHRSGETSDTFIADLAVGLSCEYIKAGAPVRGERVCKYNRLMEIEESLS